MTKVKVTPTAHTVSGHEGFPINVWDYGGDGPVLLLAHCTGAVARTWDPVVRHLDGYRS